MVQTNESDSVKETKITVVSELEDCVNGDGIIATGRHPKFQSSLSLSPNMSLPAKCGARWR